MDSTYLTLSEISLKYNIPYILCSTYIKNFEIEQKEDKYHIENEAFTFFIMTVSQKKPLLLQDLKAGILNYIISFLQENDQTFSKINFYSFNEHEILFQNGYYNSKEMFKILKLNLMIKFSKLSTKLKEEKYNGTYYPSKVDIDFLYFIFPYIDSNRIIKLLKNTEELNLNEFIKNIKDDILKTLNMIEYELDIYYVKKKAI